MRFERGLNAKEALGIGLEGAALGITGITAEAEVKYYSNRGKNKSAEIRLKKRWYIPLRWVLFLLKKEKISSHLLKIFFYARYSSMNGFIESTIESFGIWISMRSIIRKARKKKEFARIELTGSGWRMETNGNSNSYSNVYFSFQTSDVKKAAKLKEDDKELKGVIYNGKVYPMGPHIKELVV